MDINNDWIFRTNHNGEIVGMHYLVSYEEYDKEPVYLWIADTLLTAKILIIEKLGISTLDVDKIEWMLTTKENQLAIIEYNIGDASYYIRQLPYAVQ